MLAHSPLIPYTLTSLGMKALKNYALENFFASDLIYNADILEGQ